MLAEVRIRAVASDHPVTRSSSEFDEWGEISPEAQGMEISRWLIEAKLSGDWQEVGNL